MLNPDQIQASRESWQEASAKNQGDLGDAFEWAHQHASELLQHEKELRGRIEEAKAKAKSISQCHLNKCGGCFIKTGELLSLLSL